MQRKIVIFNAVCTQHAIVQLADQTHGVFIDSLKTFDTVDDSVLLKNLEIFGVSTTIFVLFDVI